MTQFFESSCAVAIWIIAILELLLLGFMVYRYIKTKSKITLLTAFITFGLFFDAFIIALGAFTSAENLRVISQFRFIAHGLLIPLLFAICALALDFKSPWNKVLYILTAVLMVAGLAEAIATNLEVREIANISRMASSDLTPSWANAISRVLSFGTVIPLMAFGIAAWIKQKTPFLFLSGFFMFAFSALGPATGNSAYIFYISMYGELLMVTFLLLYAIKKEGRFI